MSSTEKDISIGKSFKHRNRETEIDFDKDIMQIVKKGFERESKMLFGDKKPSKRFQNKYFEFVGRLTIYFKQHTDGI